jgi:general secretion pathway protein C
MDVFFKKYFWVVNLALIAICASFAGRAAAHFVEGAYLAGEEAHPTLLRRSAALPPPMKVHGKEPDAIIKRDIFCSGCMPAPAAAPDANTPQSNEPQKSTLQLELVSTMWTGEDLTSMAIIRDLTTKEKDSSLFAKDSVVFTTGATVVKVVPKRVYLRNAGRLEYLEVEGTAPPAAATTAAVVAPPVALDPAMGDIDKGVTCTGNNCNVDRSLVEKMLQNTTMLATAARFVPSIKDGRPNGFKLYAIRPNSIFGKIGLQNGDTIKGINGSEMSTPDKALEMYTKLRNASHLSVQVERRGETLTLDYTIR